MATSVAKLDEVLKSKISLSALNCDRLCNYDMLKPKQFDALLASTKGDVMCILPTGYGKSLVYELLPYYHDCVLSNSGILKRRCVVVVISPLNSIVEEQSKRLGSRCIKVDSELTQLFLKDTSQLNVSQRLLVNRLRRCDCKYVMGLPEHILCDVLIPVFKAWSDVKCFIVIDEGHCVVQWSVFRPRYGHISSLRSLLPGCNLLVFTATASSAMQKEVSELLLLESPRYVTGTIDRPNICMNVVRIVRDKLPVEEVFIKCMQPLFDELRDNIATFPKTVVYCKLHYVGIGYERGVMNQLGDHVGMYHAHLPDDEDDKAKTDTADEMKSVSGKIKLLFATEAYSMGTDVANIRRVIHFGPPSCIEVYFQEIGRAGRDNLQSFATLFFQSSDVSTNVTNVTLEMKQFCTEVMCRRKKLLAFFGQQPSYTGSRCLCCDVCKLTCDCDACTASL